MDPTTLTECVDQVFERMKAKYPLGQQVALVTGASSGIGRAVASRLAREGARLCIVGRNTSALNDVASDLKPEAEVRQLPLDITANASLDTVQACIAELGRLDILVHCAAFIQTATMQNACVDDLDRQYATNVRAPYALTKVLLPMLSSSRGQVVFLNSSAGLDARRPETGQYAATKHALRAIADSLREELNPQGVRVLSLYLGQTATPMQEALYRKQGKEYRPELLLQPDDVATVVLNTLLLPRTAEITDISIRPMRNPD